MLLALLDSRRAPVTALVAVTALAGCGGGGGARPVAAPRQATVARSDVAKVLRVRSIGRLSAPVQDPAAAVTAAGRVVLLGGLTAADTSTDAVVTVPGARGGRLPQPQHDAGAASLGRFVYVFGGGNTASFDHILRYDPRGGRVTSAGRLPGPRSDVAVAALGDTAYIVGGYDGHRATDQIVAWRPGRAARVVARLPAAIRYAAVAAAGRRLIIAGGSVGSRATTTIYAFDPATGVRRIGRLPRPTTHAAAAALGDRIYVVGGRGADARSQSTEIVAVDALTGRARRVGRLRRPTSDAAVVAFGGRLLVAGGRTRSGTLATLSELRLAAAAPAR